MQSETEGVPTAPSLQVCLENSRALGQEALSTIPSMPTAATHFRASSQRGNEHSSGGWGSRSPLVPLPTNTRCLYTLPRTRLWAACSGHRWWAWGREDPASSHMGRELAAAELLGGCVRAGGFPSQALPPPVLADIPASSSCPPRTLPPCQQQPEAAPPRTPGALKAQPARPKPRPVTANLRVGPRHGTLKSLRVFSCITSNRQNSRCKRKL